MIHEIQEAVQTAIEHVYAAAFRLGVLDVDADTPLKRLAALWLPAPLASGARPGMCC